MVQTKFAIFFTLVCVLMLFLFSGCAQPEKIADLSELSQKTFAVPTGTVADQLVLSRFPDAEFQYYQTVLDCAMAVKSRKADAVAYDEPLLRNIAAKNPGLIVLEEMITIDEYGFAVRPEDTALQEAINAVLFSITESGTYEDMLARWLPKTGSPGPMPEIFFSGNKEKLIFGTAAVTEPFSFVGAHQQIIGFDIELISYVAQALGKDLVVVDYEFGGLIPALLSKKVDVIGACITITEEREKQILFSSPYYTGGIAALVRQ